VSVRSDAATDRFSYTAANPPNPSAGFTVTLWAYLSVDRNDFSTLLRLHSGSGGSTTLNLATGGSGETPCIFSPGNTGGVVGGRPLVVGQWSRVAVTVTGTTGIIYVADTKVGATTSATGTVSGGSAPTGLTFAGRSAGDGTEWFNGRLAYARLWSSVLTQAQIEAEWLSTTPIITSNGWAAYPLTVHTDLTDHSGNGRNLVAGSTALTTEADPPLATLVTGTVSAPLGGLGTSVTGKRAVKGVSVTGPATFSTSIIGLRKVRGSTAIGLGPVAVAVVGRRLAHGVVAAPLGGLGVTVVGRRGVRGTEAVSLGALSSTVVGRRRVRAATSALLGPLVVAATGRRRVVGVTAASLGALAATAGGHRAAHATVSASLGALHCTALAADVERTRGPVAVLAASPPAVVSPFPRRWAAILEAQH
jgi:hypothetical protein